MGDVIPIYLLVRDGCERRAAAGALSAVPGWVCAGAGSNTGRFLRAGPPRPDAVVVLDTSLPNGRPKELIRTLRKSANPPRCLLWVEDIDRIRALHLLACGAQGAVWKRQGVSALIAGIQSLVNHGVSLPPDLVADLLSGWQERHVANSRLSLLTPRQYEILSALAAEHSYEGVAQRLGLGLETVRSHLKRAYVRLGIRRGMVEAIQLYEREFHPRGF